MDTPLSLRYNADMSSDIIPHDYQEFLQAIKSSIRQAQLRALVAVNRELILLYWRIGKGILERQEQQGWGTGVIDQLSRDLHKDFPEMIMWNAIRLIRFDVFGVLA